MTALRLWPLPLPAAFAQAQGAGAVLGCEGEPLPADYSRMGVAMPARLEAAVPKRRREYLAGRMAALAALSAAGAGSLRDLSSRDDRLPEWPPGWHGSISHSGTLAVAWAAPALGPQACGGVGIDVEHWLSAERCQRLQHRIAPELHGLPPGPLPATAALTLAFSAKESLFKALYPQVRRYLGFDAAQVLEMSLDGRRVRLRLSCDWSADWPADTELRAWAHVDEAAGQVMTLVQLPNVK